MGLKTRAEKVGLIAGILIIIGSILPWGTAPAGLFIGLEGAGMITFFLGIISLFLLAISSWGTINKIGQPILGIFVILIVGINILEITDIPGVSVGFGIPLTIFGGIILLLLPFIGWTPSATASSEESIETSREEPYHVISKCPECGKNSMKKYVDYNSSICENCRYTEGDPEDEKDIPFPPPPAS